MATCDANELLQAGRCWQCLSPEQLQIVNTSLLCEIWIAANPMATCDVNSLLAAGSCFNCLSTEQLFLVQTQLLCEILQGGGTGGTCLICGDGAPTEDAPCSCSIYYSNPPNAGVWVWDDATSTWEMILNPGT